VHAEDDSECNMSSIIKRFQKEVPKNAEVVIDFNHSVGGVSYFYKANANRCILNQYASGTALIQRIIYNILFFPVRNM